MLFTVIYIVAKWGFIFIHCRLVGLKMFIVVACRCVRRIIDYLIWLSLWFVQFLVFVFLFFLPLRFQVFLFMAGLHSVILGYTTCSTNKSTSSTNHHQIVKVSTVLSIYQINPPDLVSFKCFRALKTTNVVFGRLGYTKRS